MRKEWNPWGDGFGLEPSVISETEDTSMTSQIRGPDYATIWQFSHHAESDGPYFVIWRKQEWQSSGPHNLHGWNAAITWVGSTQRSFSSFADNGVPVKTMVFYSLDEYFRTVRP